MTSLSGELVPYGDVACKQRAWDKPGVLADVLKLNVSLPDRRDQARLLALSAPHSGDWLNALPISSCGLRLDDEAVRIAVGLRLDFVSRINVRVAHSFVHKELTV